MRNTKYLKLFELKLQPAVGDKLSVWSDQRIAAGAHWHSEIERQLHAATAALLLVSDTFLSSSYIRTVELPTILERHAKEGLERLLGADLVDPGQTGGALRITGRVAA